MWQRPESEPRLNVIDDADRLAAVLPPIRRRMLELLDQADSATGLARRLGLARQKINYHLRELEKAGLVECAEERQRRGCVERRMRRTASAFVLSPAFLGTLAADPEAFQDRFSSAYLMAVASRTLRDVGVLRERAAAADKRLVTLTAETEVAFASPAALKAFAEELTTCVALLAAKFHQPQARGARRYRFAVGGYPTIRSRG